MNTVGNLPIEPAAPPDTDVPVAPSKSPADKKCEGKRFDSVLSEKQKSASGTDEKPETNTPSHPGRVSGKKNAETNGDAHDARKEGDAATNLAMAVLLATQAGQKLPEEKNTAAQNAVTGIEQMPPDQSLAKGTPIAGGGIAQFLVESAGPKTPDAAGKTPIENAKPAETDQTGQSTGSQATVSTGARLTPQATPDLPGFTNAHAEKTSGKAEAKTASVSTASEPPAPPQSPRLRVESGTVAPLAIEVRDTAVLRLSAAVPQPGGMSLAMQHPNMQNAHHQQANPETTTAASSPSAPASATMKTFTPTNSDENSKGNPDSEKSFDAQTLFPGSATQSRPSEISSQPATSGSFSSALENTRQMQTVMNHVIESAGQMRSDGRANVELQVPLHDGQNLTIQLHLSNGELQPVFKTESAELRSAIQQSWSQFTGGASERGLKITTPVFQSSQSGMGDLTQRQNREQQQQAGTWHNENYSLPSQIKTGIARARVEAPKSASTQPAQGLALYA